MRLDKLLESEEIRRLGFTEKRLKELSDIGDGIIRDVMERDVPGLIDIIIELSLVDNMSDKEKLFLMSESMAQFLLRHPPLRIPTKPDCWENMELLGVYMGDVPKLIDSEERAHKLVNTGADIVCENIIKRPGVYWMVIDMKKFISDIHGRTDMTELEKLTMVAWMMMVNITSVLDSYY